MELNKVKIYLDDYRQPRDCLSYMHTRIGVLNPIYNEEWLVVTNYPEFVQAIDKHKGNISHISFDHDLGEEHYALELTDKQEWEDYHLREHEETGLDCAKYFKNLYDEEKLEYPILFVHSMNPVGRQNIINLFK